MTIVRSPAVSPASVPAPAGSPEQQLLEALVERYGTTEFTARTAAADITRELWVAAGVPRPDAGSVGRWLRSHKGQAHGFALSGKVDRNGANRWRLRGIEARKAETANAKTQAEAIPRAPAPPPLLETTPPKPLPAPEARTWWSIAPGASPAAGGAVERPRGAWWTPQPETAP